MDDSCAVCADSLEWAAYGSCGHREVCSTCVVRLRFVLDDRRCCICKTECPTVFITKAMGDYTRVITDFSAFPPGASEGQIGSFWYHEGSQAYFDDVDQYRMIKAMCRLSCSICDKNAEEQGSEAAKRRSKFRNIEQLKGHLFHQHRMFMCSLCMEGRKVFISEQKLYTRSQLNQHINTGDSEVDGTETERGGFMGHPMCEFCRNPFYGDNELYMHMSTEHYTCHICQRQHPGQYDYFRNYDDLETHFRQDHFLCEDEACLGKKFIVFQSEAEMKRHSTIEHGGHMSRSKRNAALQIPTSFRYRSNDQEQRRGRGRGFRPDSSNNQLSMAIQASLETAIADGRVRESSSGIQPVTGRGDMSQVVERGRSSLESAVNSGPELPSRSNTAHGQSSRNTHILEDSYFPPLADYEPLEPSSRYAQVLNQGSATKLGEESFPPLPGMKKGSKPKAKHGPEVSGNNTLASRLHHKKGSVKVLHSARPNPSGIQDLNPSNSASFPQIGSTQNHGLLASSSNSKPQTSTNQVANSSTPSRGNGFVSPVSANTTWNSVSGNKMRHSSSAPSLVDASNQHTPSLGSSASGKQVMPTGSQTLPRVEDVHTANKSLIERIRAVIGNDDGKFAAFKSISAEYRLGEINTWEYLSYVEQFGLSHLVPELARLCPDPRKQKELTDAYSANIRDRSRQENRDTNAGNSKESKLANKKGKGIVVDRADTTTGKDALADSFLNTVRKLQLNQKPQEEVEVLSKDGYRRAKSQTNNLESSSSIKETLINSTSSSQKSAVATAEENDSKQRKKTSKFHRVRLGDGSAAALLNVGRSNFSPERPVEEPNKKTPPGSLPVRGVWRNKGGQKLFADGQSSQ
ncbi:zinc finger protein 598-like [Iris pallida]|uniref:RING-type E3 ubiquitin transferase n=1 Tax=Iris pallida TaxID=29817 RepID=A0AAX6DV60_IRIPA|nr:zinc finger protein 598-like [Iris pallida]